jgi:cytidylate kinase
MVVAIDGPAGVGKSTIARAVAEKAGFLYLNSGSFYRAITWEILNRHGDPSDVSEAIHVARACRLDFREGVLNLNDIGVENLIRTDVVDQWVSRHSSIPEVREAVNLRLRRFAEGHDVVADGRDIGTVVFPNADAKIFLDADVKTRAERRFRQGVSGLSLAEIERAIGERDLSDRSKPVGRLDVAADALYIDTSHLTIYQVCERVIQAILLKKNHLGDIRRV